MIGKLKGLVDTKALDHVILDVNGVGYVVACSSRVLGQLPAVGERVEMFVETLVREDEIRLIGFSSHHEQSWFRLLTGVQGVGPKVALAILGTLTPHDLGQALATGDKAMIGRAPGVGPKVALRLITELKDKVPALETIDPSLLKLNAAQDLGSAGGAGEAVSALTNLGYGISQATAAVAKVVSQLPDGTPTAQLIRAALKELAA